MNKKTIIFCFLLAFFCLFESIHVGGKKVKVDFYYESGCPHSISFITGSLKAAANTEDFWKICDFNLIPFGFTVVTKNGSSWAYKCQHGQKECYAHQIQACAINNYDYYSQGLPFAICLHQNISNFNIQGQSCAQKYSMDWNNIYQCANGKLGNLLLHEYGIVTKRENPPTIPWIVVNGKHSEKVQNKMNASMISYICSIYTGIEQIQACK